MASIWGLFSILPSIPVHEFLKPAPESKSWIQFSSAAESSHSISSDSDIITARSLWFNICFIHAYKFPVIVIIFIKIVLIFIFSSLSLPLLFPFSFLWEGRGVNRERLSFVTCLVAGPALTLDTSTLRTTDKKATAQCDKYFFKMSSKLFVWTQTLTKHQEN